MNFFKSHIEISIDGILPIALGGGALLLAAYFGIRNLIKGQSNRNVPASDCVHVLEWMNLDPIHVIIDKQPGELSEQTLDMKNV